MGMSSATAVVSNRQKRQRNVKHFILISSVKKYFNLTNQNNVFEPCSIQNMLTSTQFQTIY